MRKSTLIILTMLLVFAVHSYAAIPRLINYQGRLTDSQGTPITGTKAVTFRIYDVESGGSALWNETYSNLAFDKGIFNVMLGGVTALNLAFDKSYWLSIQVGGDAEMTPRLRLASAAYAFRAENANSVTGVVPVANGGTGQTSANSSLNALLPNQSGNAGKVLKSDGSNASWGLLGGWQIIEEWSSDTTVTSKTFSGLTGNSYKFYMLVGTVFWEGTSGRAELVVRLNGDTTNHSCNFITQYETTLTARTSTAGAVVGYKAGGNNGAFGFSVTIPTVDFNGAERFVFGQGWGSCGEPYSVHTSTKYAGSGEITSIFVGGAQNHGRIKGRITLLGLKS